MQGEAPSEVNSCDDLCYKRAISCVLGAFIGDAAGATLEFIGQKNITPKSVNTAMLLKGGGVFNVGPG